MATIVLQAAGAFLGGLFGSTAAAIGTAAGAIAGYALDRALIGSTRHVEGPRLAAARAFSAEDGAPMPRLYGTARLGGTLIWATRFEEASRTERRGAKGGPKVTSYSYYGNAAFALCEGEVAHIRRVWADGREVDTSTIAMRLHRGTGDQEPDPLIEAKQGEGNTPAYRGTAYVVLERLPLDDYGNRLPQMQFEVVRPVGPLARNIRAMAIIPGSTEFGYMPEEVTQGLTLFGHGEQKTLNRHVRFGDSDFTASLDELQATCPNLANVALVVTWFGDDLRAGECAIRPAVSDGATVFTSTTWSVAGLGRDDAPSVSSHDGRPAYGGTPADQSVLAAIAELKARGLGVTLYPFVMMDVAAGNGLPDPHGGAEQAAYPWRGRISCHPAPGRPGTSDRSAAARGEVDAFMGEAAAGDFAISPGNVGYSGSSSDWGYRRFVLHYAALAAAAGGVDAFVIGSELRGLTQVRDGDDAFPAVDHLAAIAAEARALVGAATKITYAADWSEYSGYHPADGSGDHFFHLDPLWASEAIDAVGIDNYMPLADWRDEDREGTGPDGATGPYDPEALRGAISGGEGFDWFYADAGARMARDRTPITDGAYARPWVFRYKDIAGWWSNPHHERHGGVEDGAPTAWIPCSKPVWFTELGCPACDKGPNQPNVFHDPKSAESALPHFSGGQRSDLAQKRFLEAHLDYWDPASAGFAEGGNPVSDVYGGRMLDAERIYLWAWDARPFPAFPLATDVWGDGANWRLGHWLNGRLANPSVADLIAAVLADSGLPPADTRHADGSLAGYVVPEPTSPRTAIEALAETFGLAVVEDGQGLTIRGETALAGPAREPDELLAPDDGPAVSLRRDAVHDLPGEAILGFLNPMRDYQSTTATARHPAAASRRQERRGIAGALDAENADNLVTEWLRRTWLARETVAFAVPAADRAIGPGSLVRLPDGDPDRIYLVTEIEEGVFRSARARRVERAPALPHPSSATTPAYVPPQPLSRPLVHFLDLPAMRAGDGPAEAFRVAAWTRPWRTQVAYASPEDSGFENRAVIARPAVAGVLTAPLEPGPWGRIDRRATIGVRLFDGALSSVSELQLLNGANAAAIGAAAGGWEIVQFGSAVEVAPDEWLLANLLRGQLGTDDALAATIPQGAPFVLLDETVVAAGLKTGEAGLPLNWRVGPAGRDFGGPLFDAQPAAGGVRARLPLAPVHLRAARLPDGDIALSWIRRGRVDADRWSQDDIPLGEEEEAYEVSVYTFGGGVPRRVETTTPGWLYPAAGQAADLGPDPAQFEIGVRQKTRRSGTAGIERRIRLTSQ